VKNRCASDETDSLVSSRAEEAAKREVQKNEVEQTIARPESIVPGQLRRQIFMRRYNSENATRETRHSVKEKMTGRACFIP
jgi:hypothetical protein